LVTNKEGKYYGSVQNLPHMNPDAEDKLSLLGESFSNRLRGNLTGYFPVHYTNYEETHVTDKKVYVCNGLVDVETLREAHYELLEKTSMTGSYIEGVDWFNGDTSDNLVYLILFTGS